MHKKTSRAALGAMLVALSALGYATNPILGKLAFQSNASPITLGAIRFTSAALGLWLWLVATRRVELLPLLGRIRLTLLGALGMGINSLLFFGALPKIDASLAAGIFYTYPAMVTIIGALRGQPLRQFGVLGLLFTTAGTWLLLGTGTGDITWQGAALIFGNACGYTVFILVSERWTEHVTPMNTSAHIALGAALVYIVLAITTDQQWPQTEVFAAGLGLALCSTILAFVTFFAGLPMVGSSRAAIISTLEPVFTAVLAVFFLDERLAVLQMAGIGLVVLGAVAVQRRDQSTPLDQQA